MSYSDNDSCSSSISEAVISVAVFGILIMMKTSSSDIESIPDIINLKQYIISYTESQCCSKDTNEIPDDKFEGDILHLHH